VVKSEQKEDTPLNSPSTPTTPSRRLDTPPRAEGDGERRSAVDFSAWQLAWELGYTIAIPIVVLALAGRWADKYFKTEPWLLLSGIVVSIFISSFLVYRRVKDVLK